MAISGRFVLLSLLGLIPVALLPGWGSATVVVLLLAAAALLDLGLAASLRQVSVQRNDPGSVPLTGSAESVLTVSNAGRRALRGLVRDAWQPSAGAQDPSQRVHVPAGERRRMTVTLRPTRRGILAAAHVTVRAFGPLGLSARQRTLSCPGSLRVLPPFHARRHLPSKLRQLRELDGRAAVQIRGAGIAHAAAEPADELVDRVAERSGVGNPSLDALGDQLASSGADRRRARRW